MKNFLSIQNKSDCRPRQQCNAFIPFGQRLEQAGRTLKKDGIATIQVNVGSLCNQSCIHCHVEASPQSSCIMPLKVMEEIIALLRSNQGLNVDITGGAPELHPHIEDFISQCSGLAVSISLRSNLTALMHNRKIIKTLIDNRVELICSLPDISAEKTDQQRGKGVFENSVHILRILNNKGYGHDIPLHLAHNPTDFVLPELQRMIENRYRDYLKTEYGVAFNRLFILNNMPVGRFKKLLDRQKNYAQYMSDLSSNFNPSTVCGLMCRYILNIGWDGRLYDCDFNNALGLQIKGGFKLKGLHAAALTGNDIHICDHCYGCTAVKGSGCFGTVVK